MHNEVWGCTEIFPFLFFSFHKIEDLRCSNCVSHGTKHAETRRDCCHIDFSLYTIVPKCNTIYR